jgi:uracil-DNA glycosylase
MPASLQRLKHHQNRLRQCTRCPAMQGPPVTGNPVLSTILLVGQAPGPKEIDIHRPFAWTAGKTLFGWFSKIGLDEAAFREHVYMAAVCRCFPGKTPKGGDRVPAPAEVTNCAPWLAAEMEILQPRLILPVGKLAIGRFLSLDKLTQVVGKVHHIELQGKPTDVIPLPHPSGASTWHRMEPGKSLLKEALGLIQQHSAWRSLTDT